MQCSSYMSLSLSHSLPLSFLATIFCFLFSDSYIAGVRATRQRGTSTALGTVCQLVERDSNSIGWLDCSRPSWRAGPFRFFAPVPSFAFHRAPAPDKTCRLVFVLLHQTFIPPCAMRYSDLFYPLPDPPASRRVPLLLSSFSPFLFFSLVCSTTTDRHGTAT